MTVEDAQLAMELASQMRTTGTRSRPEHFQTEV